MGEIMVFHSALGGVASAEETVNNLTSLGEVDNPYLFESSLGKVMDYADTIASEDLESAFGYMHVLSGATRAPNFKLISPAAIGRVAVTQHRLASIIKAGTDRQAKESLRPNVKLIFYFDHDAANIAAGGVQEATAKPDIPGIDDDPRDVPLTLRHIFAFMKIGNYKDADLTIQVQSVPSVQIVVPTGVTAPVGEALEIYSPATYQAGADAPILRDVDKISLLKNLKVTSKASAVCRYQLVWYMRANSRLTGRRCKLTQGPSILGGPAGIMG